MIFLIEYDRRNAKLLYLQRYRDDERLAAQNARIEREVISNQRQTGSEIVLLEAESEETIRKTHARYFERIDSQETLDRLVQNALPLPAH
jgi:low affinity Fe/Cu permease